MISDIDFFARNPEREYRLRLAFPEEIAALDPPPDPALFVYMAKCRYMLGIKAVFETEAAPKIGELDSEVVAQEIFRGLLEKGSRIS
jgi:hypothetical protein